MVSTRRRPDCSRRLVLAGLASALLSTKLSPGWGDARFLAC